MQGLLKYSRLVLALALILLLESSVQGYPMQKARYQWVRCNSANCIEEQGPEFDLGPDDTKRIIPLKTGSSKMNLEKLQDVFPLSEDLSGSGSGSGSGFLTEIDQEYQPVDESNVFYDNFRSHKRNLLSNKQDLDLGIPEEDIFI